jgi:enediyne biosynthesis protein E4
VPYVRGLVETPWTVGNVLFPLEFMPSTWTKDSSWNGFEQDKLFFNDHGKRFVEVGSVLGGVDEARADGRGAAVLDYDNDGDLDLVVANRNAPPYLLENRLGGRKHWLKVRLVGTKSNRDAVGARVLLRTTGYQLLQEKRLGQGYASCSAVPLFYGLGERTAPVTLEVRWPLGERQTFTQVPVDGEVTLVEGKPGYSR